MIICSNCGYENNPDDALSCSLCGKVFRKESMSHKTRERIKIGGEYKIIVKCPNCGHPNEDKIEICVMCKEKLPKETVKVRERGFWERLKKRKLNWGEVFVISFCGSWGIVVLLGILGDIFKIEVPLLMIAGIFIFLLFWGSIFMEKKVEDIIFFIGFPIGMIVGISISLLYDKITGWKHDPSRLPWAETWTNPGTYIGMGICLLIWWITGKIVEGYLKKKRRMKE